ncbi:hypothetical protein IWW55_002814 [Coemansia sp. RSA 2706]|nr:hypothetical protein IWW55_002814 [Coemansia sp. RSA 2706]
MELNELPEDIIIQILKHVGFMYIHELGLWDASLVLLAVCRKWRCLAAPLIYSGVYIHYSENNDTLASSEPKSAVLRTSIDLVAATNNTSLVKYIDVNIECAIFPFRGLEKVIETLKAVAPTWPSVNKLVINLEYMYGIQDNTMLDAAALENATLNIVAELGVLLPSLHKLIMDDCATCNIHNNLYEGLANRYAGRLQLLESSQEIQPLDVLAFSRLTSLALTFTSFFKHYVPQVCVESLRRLSLAEIPSFNVWLLFRRANEPAISFTELKHLYIKYRFGNFDEMSVDVNQVRLRFPNIKCLTVKCLHQYCPVLANGVFPAYLHKLDIECSAAACRLADKLAIQCIQELKLGLQCNAADLPGAFPAVERLLSKTVGRKNVMVSIVNGSIGCMLNTKWPRITGLQTLAPTTVHEMLTILNCVPSLTKLMLHSFTLHELSSVMDIPEIESDRPLAPLHTDLRLVMLSYRASITPAEYVIAIIKYLAVRTPLLERVVAWQLPLNSLTEFVAEYKSVYPHLRNIEFVGQEADRSLVF